MHADGNAEVYLQKVTLSNNGATDVDVNDVTLLVATTGGWPVARSELYHVGTGTPTRIGAGGSFTLTVLDRWTNSPLTHVLVYVRGQPVGGAAVEQLAQLPIVVDASTSWPAGVTAPVAPVTPAALPIDAPAFLGLQTPIETIDVVRPAGVARWLGFAGQIVNCSQRALTLLSWNLSVVGTVRQLPVGRAQKRTLVNDTTPPRFTSSTALSGASVDLTAAGAIAAGSAYGFFVGHDLATNATPVTATISVDVDDGGTRRTLTRTESVGAAPVVSQRTPVEYVATVAADGLGWTSWNGPADSGFNLHNAFPDRRYAYDVILATASGTDADPAAPQRNSNHWAWSRTFVAPADGSVVYVEDSAIDNWLPGATGQNGVFLRHTDSRFPNGVYTILAHHRHETAAVAVGDAVVAGQPLAAIGNTGGSSEPHLHVACITYDDTGRLRALPIGWTNLASPLAGTVLPGGPIGVAVA